MFLARHQLRHRMNIKQNEVTCIEDFLLSVEQTGQQTYSSLVIQNAADIAREKDRLHSDSEAASNTTVLALDKEVNPNRNEDMGKRMLKSTFGGYRSTPNLFHSDSITIPLSVGSLAQSAPGTSGRSMSLHTVLSLDDSGNLQSPRKQPPPKPKRNPTTRLSASYEAVSACLIAAAKDLDND
ncbi:hypothetical protein AB205_0171050, partial [Aquarana catesbeiana]